MKTIATIARTIADTTDLGASEALTVATTYAIQMGVDCGVQEGGQAPHVELGDETAALIADAAQSGADLPF